MRHLLKWPLRLAFAAALACALTAHAGQTCEEKKATPATVERSLTLAVDTMKSLDASGSRVVLLARSGRDLSKYGLRYSHLGFAYQQPDGRGGHVWRILHKLNECGTAGSSIYREGLGQFFLDDMWRYEAAYVVPSPEVQERLMALLQDDSRALRLQHKPYSLVSYAWGLTYQQSNQWAIETLAEAMEPSIRNREQAQAWLKLRDYQPTVLNLGPLTRLGARMTAANVAFDDHPNSKRFTDHIETVTVDSVFAWLQRAGLGAQPVVVALAQP